VLLLVVVLLLLLLLGRVGRHRERQQREGYHLNSNMCCGSPWPGAAAVAAGPAGTDDLRKVSQSGRAAAAAGRIR
jgi:hypothetical protein